MNKLVGCVLVLGGVAFGVWAGLWWGFIGGIVASVEAIRADPVVALDIAYGIARVVFCGAIGTIAGLVPCAIGAAMLEL